jgi:hypothetical protein
MMATGGPAPRLRDSGRAAPRETRRVVTHPEPEPQRTVPYRSPTGISTATVLPGCARGQAQAGS